MEDPSSVSAQRRAMVDYLASLSRSGVTHLPRPPAAQFASAGDPPAMTPEIVATSDAPPSTRKETSLPSDDSPSPRLTATRNLPTEERTAALEIVRREVAACQRCEELARTRTQTVFGVGNPRARLCFMGEAPGADEDRQGEPFVGRAGQLLTKIIEACTLARDDVYILNTLKCRPPGNRNPSPDEVDHCREYLDRQLEIIQPEFICCLGAVAAKALLSTETSIGRLRGRFHDYRGIRVLCTYHPAYLLRNPSAKRQVWEDMQVLMGEMGIELPTA